MRRRAIITVCLCFLAAATAATAKADCIYDGVSYPTGTKLGDLTCQPDGTWK